MLRRRFGNGQRAQAIMEYTIVIGAITMVLFSMNTFLKRGIQGMIKVVADQVGYQENAEQAFDDSGHMESSYLVTRSSLDKTTREFAGVINYSYSDTVSTSRGAVLNLGFTEED